MRRGPTPPLFYARVSFQGSYIVTFANDVILKGLMGRRFGTREWLYLYYFLIVSRDRESPSLDDDGFQSHFVVKSIILRCLFFHSLNVVILSQLSAKSVKGECGTLDHDSKVPSDAR